MKHYICLICPKVNELYPHNKFKQKKMMGSTSQKKIDLEHLQKKKLKKKLILLVFPSYNTTKDMRMQCILLIYYKGNLLTLQNAINC